MIIFDGFRGFPNFTIPSECPHIDENRACPGTDKMARKNTTVDRVASSVKGMEKT